MTAPVKGTLLWSDTFNRADATGVANVGNGWGIEDPYGAGGGDLNINSNRLQRIGSGSYYLDTNAATGSLPDDLWVEMDFTGNPSTWTFFGLAARLDAGVTAGDPNGIKGFFADGSSFAELEIGSGDAFDSTATVTADNAFPSGWLTNKQHTMGFAVVGNTGYVYIDGVLVAHADYTVVRSGGLIAIAGDVTDGAVFIDEIRVYAIGVSAQTVSPSGIASGEAFGTPTVAPGPVTVSPAGIASGEAFGAPTVTRAALTIAPAGIASGEAFGTPTVTLGAITVSPTGIPSGEAFGTPTVSRLRAGALPAGIVPVRSLTTDEILTGNRFTRFRFDLLDENEAPKGTLGEGLAGSVSYTANASVKGKCSLSIVDNGQSINFLADRVRPVILVDGLPERPLGVFVFTGVPETWADTGRVWSTTLLDKTTIPGQSAPATTYALDAGTVVTDQIVTILTDLGETNVAITPSTATLSSPLVWDVSDVNVTWLKIINDLLKYINYFSLYCDENGQYRGEPYTKPAARPITWEFLDGPTAIYSPAFTRAVDLYGIPNVFVAVSQGDGTTAGLKSTARNDNPDSPYSTVNRPTITQKATGVQIADQATLDAYTQRRLIELTSPTSGVDIVHAYVPGLTFNNAARLRRVPAGIDARHVVSKTEITFDGTALVKTSLTEVVDL